MPGMRFFGRRCSLASDDFLFIGLIDSIIFLPWLGWIPVICASYFKERFSCDDETTQLLLDILLPGLSAMFIANWLLSTLFVIFSSRGTISEPEPRRHVATLVYIKLITGFLDFLLAILGTFVLVRDSFCDIIGVNSVIKVCTIFLWVATVARLGMVIMFYDWNFSKRTKDTHSKEYFTAPVRRGTFKKWHLRLQAICLWCTTPSEARQQALKTASELLALLSYDLDLVASDLIAGYLLYRRNCLVKYEAEKARLNKEPPMMYSDGSKLEEFPPKDFEPWMNLPLALRYCKLGLGVFGWPWYLYFNFPCGCCSLLKRATCFFPFRNRSKIVWGDNCCGCNLAGLQSTTDLHYEDLVHISFVDKVFEVPFFVTYDHTTSAVLLTARGTMSMDDVLTDASANFGCMDDPGMPPGSLCHSGMLTAAREVKRKLDEKEVIETALKNRPTYKLVISGHSLGASVATILSMLYLPKYPNLQCFAFAPAPTLNKVALPLAHRHVISIIYGNDTVCYLNYKNVKGMVVEMVKCLKECKLPKYKVFLNSEKSYEVPDDIEKCYSIEMNNKTNGIEEINGCKEKKSDPEKDVESVLDPPCVTENAYIAGRIVHVRKRENGYQLRIASTDDYSPLMFRPRYLLDHFPNAIEKILERIGKTPVLKPSALTRPKKQ